VDTKIFHKGHAQKTKHPNHFVVFSGGKMEFRKGQDLVIRAFKVLQDRHDDVLLVNCWYNRWDAAIASMSMSPHIQFEMPRGRYVDAVRHLLNANGIQPQKAVICEPVHHSQVAEIYRDTDCGLFPNRCEGGTNLVLMEYMACGKPVIASYNTGHQDVLSREHAMLLEHQSPLDILDRSGNLHTRWYESSLDEIVWKLEWAYQNRELIREIGLAGARYISQYTWEKAALGFLPLLFNEV
jgi:glycosyltransferase involved in cell wall biosynthesis